MARFSFVHAADLHLDTPFACAKVDSAQAGEALRHATFQAWERVVSACIESGAAFLLVAGDIYDASQKSLRAQLRFRQGLERLDQHAIPAFVAHGNHDPLDSVSATLPPPPNTYIFGPEVETREVRQDGRLLAQITGVSHPQKNEWRNLARLFPARAGGAEALQVALLHCNVGAETGHEPYAPCELEDLAATGYHYWALGHAHERRFLCRTPWVVYAGNTQGRSLRESGARGCFVVEADGTDILGEPSLIETDAVRWLSSEIDVDPYLTTQDLLNGLIAECRRLQQEGAGRPVAARLILHGRSPLYRELRRTGHAADLEESVREEAAAWTPFVHLAAFEIKMRPPLDLESLRTTPDLLGELLRAGDHLTREDCLRIWEPLLEDPRFNRSKLRRVLEELDWQDAASQAKYLCADLLCPDDAV